MIIAKCDKCGRTSGNAKDVERIYLYDSEFDLCDECMEIYEEVEGKMADMAIKKREECEIVIKEEALKMMREFERKGEKNEKESI